MKRIQKAQRICVTTRRWAFCRSGFLLGDATTVPSWRPACETMSAHVSLVSGVSVYYLQKAMWNVTASMCHTCNTGRVFG